MEKISIPDTELELSPIGFGCVNAGVKWDKKEADYLFDAFLDMGGNVYDTARVYSDWIPPEIGTVSYTHLDVYKRQIYGRCYRRYQLSPWTH